MTEINRDLPPNVIGDRDLTARSAPLDISLIEHYLVRSRVQDHVSVDALHLAQMCNELWRGRREYGAAGMAGNEIHRREQQRANRLAEQAVKAIANVGYDPQLPAKRPQEATAIVMVANLLAEGLKARAELADWHEGRRRPQHEAARELRKGVSVYGNSDALKTLEEQLEELEQWRTGQRRHADELSEVGQMHKLLIDGGWIPPSYSPDVMKAP